MRSLFSRVDSLLMSTPRLHTFKDDVLQLWPKMGRLRVSYDVVVCVAVLSVSFVFRWLSVCLCVLFVCLVGVVFVCLCVWLVAWVLLLA